jgi:hypothetical protein
MYETPPNTDLLKACMTKMNKLQRVTCDKGVPSVPQSEHAQDYYTFANLVMNGYLKDILENPQWRRITDLDKNFTKEELDLIITEWFRENTNWTKVNPRSEQHEPVIPQTINVPLTWPCIHGGAEPYAYDPLDYRDTEEEIKSRANEGIITIEGGGIVPEELFAGMDVRDDDKLDKGCKGKVRSQATGSIYSHDQGNQVASSATRATSSTVGAKTNVDDHHYVSSVHAAASSEEGAARPTGRRKKKQIVRYGD